MSDDNELHEIADGAYGDNPMVRGLARERIIQAAEDAKYEAVARALDLEGKLIAREERIASLTASNAALSREVKELRRILSACTVSLGTGAFAGEECSLEFFGHVPSEIKLSISALRDDRDALSREVGSLREEVQLHKENNRQVGLRIDEEVGRLRALLKEAETALRKFKASIPNELPDSLCTECKTHEYELSDLEVAAIEEKMGAGALLSRETNLILWFDGVTVGDFRCLDDLLHRIAALHEGKVAP